PIDHVFTVKGQGTIVRGTIYNGNVQAEQQLTLLPKKLETRVKQLQIHGKKTEIAYEGQRTAINLSGDSHQDISRSEEHTSELQSRFELVCRLLLEKQI